MLSLRARLFAIISLIVLMILGISVFLLIRAKKASTPTTDLTTEEQTALDNVNQANNVTPTEIPATAKFVPATAEETEKNAVQQFAKIFIERLNSYSSDNSFQNIRDVKTLATDNLWGVLSAKINPNAVGQNYTARSTKVFSVSLLKFSASEAEVQLQSKVSEEKDGKVITKDNVSTVSLVKQGKNWLVDKYTW